MDGIKYGVLFPAGQAQRSCFTIVDMIVIYPKTVSHLTLDDLFLAAVRKNVACEHDCVQMCINAQMPSLQSVSTLF